MPINTNFDQQVGTYTVQSKMNEEGENNDFEGQLLDPPF
jgi:hypothetical protein